MYRVRKYYYPMEWNQKSFPVYRLLSSDQFVTDFFEKGILRISSLEDFKRHPNETLRDRNEGNGTVAGRKNDATTMYMYSSGTNAFVLSTTVKISESLKNEFNTCTLAIRIDEPMLFALEIAKKLPCVSSGVEGFCDYISSKFKWIEENSEKHDTFKRIDFNSNNNSENEFHNLISNNVLFEKDLKYREENEYRLVWFSDLPVENSLMISCPEAIRYCTQIKL